MGCSVSSGARTGDEQRRVSDVSSECSNRSPNHAASATAAAPSDSNAASNTAAQQLTHVVPTPPTERLVPTDGTEMLSPKSRRVVSNGGAPRTSPRGSPSNHSLSPHRPSSSSPGTGFQRAHSPKLSKRTFASEVPDARDAPVFFDENGGVRSTVQNTSIASSQGENTTPGTAVPDSEYGLSTSSRLPGSVPGSAGSGRSSPNRAPLKRGATRAPGPRMNRTTSDAEISVPSHATASRRSSLESGNTPQEQTDTSPRPAFASSTGSRRQSIILDMPTFGQPSHVVFLNGRTPLTRTTYIHLLDKYGMTNKEDLDQSTATGKFAVALCGVVEKHLTRALSSSSDANASVTSDAPTSWGSPFTKTGPMRVRMGSRAPFERRVSNTTTKLPALPLQNASKEERFLLSRNTSVTEDPANISPQSSLAHAASSSVSSEPVAVSKMLDPAFSLSRHREWSVSDPGNEPAPTSTSTSSSFAHPTTHIVDMVPSEALSGDEPMEFREASPTPQTADIRNSIHSGDFCGDSGLSLTELIGVDVEQSERFERARTRRESTASTVFDTHESSHSENPSARDADLRPTSSGGCEQQRPPQNGDGVQQASPRELKEALRTSHKAPSVSHAGSFYGRPQTVVTKTLSKRRDTAGFKAINQYTILQHLGTGTTGKVKLASSLDDELCAVKIVKRKRLRLTSSEMHREAAIMIGLHHKHIVPLVEVIDCPTSPKVYMVMQYVDGGPIVNYNHDGVCEIYREDVLQMMVRQLIGGLSYLHGKGIVHCDIKPDNLLVTHEGMVYIADFGSSLIFNKTPIDGVGNGGSAGLGTPRFMAPELFSRNEVIVEPSTPGTPKDKDIVNPAVDMWSLGVVVFSMMFGFHPFWGLSMDDVRQKVTEEPLMFPDGAPHAWQDLLSHLLDKDPERRMTMAQLRQHPWVRNKIVLVERDDGNPETPRSARDSLTANP